MMTNSSSNEILELARKDFVVLPKFFSSAEALLLKHAAEDLENQERFRPAQIGRKRELHSDIRSDQICWLDSTVRLTHPEVEIFFTKLSAIREILNRHFYLGIDFFEAHFAIYPDGAHYDRHRDEIGKDAARVLSLVTYLNEDWHLEDGGSLRIYKNGGQTGAYQDIVPEGGTLVAFLSRDVEHEVLLSHRKRLSITAWGRRRSDSTLF